MAILVTGGAGYIGSHTVLTLLERGDDVVVIDNLANASQISLDRVAELTGRTYCLYRRCSRQTGLKNILPTITSPMSFHFAGLKSVSESIKNLSPTMKTTSPERWFYWMRCWPQALTGSFLAHQLRYTVIRKACR